MRDGPLTTEEKKRETSRASHLRRLYGISIGEYQKMWDDQEGCCAVCGEPEHGKLKLAVDHDHKSGKIRGLLCFRCNKFVVGKLTLDQAQRTARYLGDPPAERSIGVRVAPKQSPRKRRPSKTTRTKKALSY